MAEQQADRRRELTYIDPYPELECYHRNDFRRYLDRLSAEYLVRRKTAAKEANTPEKAAAYCRDVRQKFRQVVGDLPDDGGAARSFVTGTVDCGSYRVDAVLIESLPDHYATANFYYPAASARPAGPLPAILFLCGHAPEGKASPTYVSFCVEAAMNGFCVLAVDPFGQGERRVRSLDGEDGQPWRDAVDAHCYLDQKLALLGEHLGAYMLHDNVKALDYLLSRSEVDPKRVGVTGNSGGGTMSAYMGAFDDRIRAVAPSCYITELRALLHRLMAQDAEQCLPNFMREGLDHSDLVTAAAPRPYMISAAMFDFFPIDGVRDAYIEAKKLYRLMGSEDKLELYVALKGHGYWHDSREQVLRFFCRHFAVPFTENKAIDYERLPDEEELRVVREQIGLPPVRKSLPDLVRERAHVTSNTRDRTVRSRPLRERVLEALQLTEEQVAHALRPVEAEGRQATRGSEAIDDPDNWTFESEPGMPISAQWAPSQEQGGSSVLLAVGEPPACEAQQSIASFVSLSGPCAGMLTVHPRGTGPAALDPKSSFGMFDPEWASGYQLRMQGKCLQGLRVLDALAAIRELHVRNGEAARTDVTLYGKEEHALTALYAAILSGVRRVRLAGLPRSFRDFLVEEGHRWLPVIFAPGLLNLFDIDELLQFMIDNGEIVIDDYRNPMKISFEATARRPNLIPAPACETRSASRR